MLGEKPRAKELFRSEDWTTEIRGGILFFSLTVILNYFSHISNSYNFKKKNPLFPGVGFSLLYTDSYKKKEIERILKGARKIRLEFTPVSADEGLSQFSLDLSFGGFTELEHSDIGELFFGNCAFTWCDFSNFEITKEYRVEQKLTPQKIGENFHVRVYLIADGTTHCFLDSSNNSAHSVRIH